MCRVENLRVRVSEFVEQGLLNMGMDVRFRFLDEQEVGDRLLLRLVLKLKKLECQVDQIGTAETELVNCALVGLAAFADKQLQTLRSVPEPSP